MTQCLTCSDPVPPPQTGNAAHQARYCEPCKAARARAKNKAAVKRWNAKRPKQEPTPKFEKTKKERVRDLVVNYKTQNPCVDCKQFWPAIVMEFDHRPGETKHKAVSRLSTATSVLAEMAKCDLVCSNCHRIRTGNRKHWLKS